MLQIVGKYDIIKVAKSYYKGGKKNNEQAFSIKTGK